MTAVVRQVTWGKALMVELSDVRGGLRAVVNAIQSEVGTHIGSRNTFAKLYDVANPTALDTLDQYRAWLVLTTIGRNPDDWGIGNKCLPPIEDPKRLAKRLPAALVRHTGLEPVTRWFEVSGNTVAWPVDLAA